MTPGTPRSHAFSLIELLIAIAVIAALLLITIPALRSAREKSTGYRCVSNLKQIGAATMQYAADNRNELPYYYYLTDSGGTGSGAYTGTWYYNLAPYLAVPHTHLSHKGINEERVRLGTKEQRITGPCVFTCPGHRTTESNMQWKPTPMTWPADKPVSYAPPLEARGSISPRGLNGPEMHPSGVLCYPVRMTEILYPSQKIWISDSGRPDLLNTSDSRWQTKDVQTENWARQGFTRHHEGGNALFYDGHVEWLPLSTFIHPANGSLAKTAKLYFNPYRNPADDR